MAFTKTDVIINNVKSSDIGISGVYVVRMGDSEISTPWIGGKNISEIKIPYKDTPLFFKTDKEPLELSLKFSILEKEYESEILFELGKLFGSDEYVSLQTVDDLSKIYYVIPTSQVNLITYGSYTGYYELNLRCNAPHAWSPIEISTYDFSDLTSPQTFEIYSKSNVYNSKYKGYYYEPEQVLIDLKGSSTSFLMYNQSDENKQYSITGLSSSESLTIKNQLRYIESSTNLNRLNNFFPRNWFRLVYGKNILQINTPCIIQFVNQFPVYI